MDVTVDEVFMWRDHTGYMAKEVFGSHYVHVNAKTYEEIKARCVLQKADPNSLLAVPFNGFSIHIAEDVPDGILRPCDCGEGKHEPS
jgi:hypothetical protein